MVNIDDPTWEYAHKTGGKDLHIACKHDKVSIRPSDQFNRFLFLQCFIACIMRQWS
ncbi:MAG: hypothetical protein H6Q26_2487 [Bacteroidetes bacterium]|nr:hypothetical protein [Bacteroidota bacterium]